MEIQHQHLSPMKFRWWPIWKMWVTASLEWRLEDISYPFKYICTVHKYAVH